MKRWRFGLLLAIGCSVSSCKKEAGALVEFQEVPSRTEANLLSVRLVQGGILLVSGGTGNSGLILRSFDNGSNWSTLYDGFDQPIFDVCFSDSLTGYASGEASEVFKTSDGGLTWQKLWINPPSWPYEFRKPLRRIFAVHDSLIFFAGGGEYEAGVIARATNGGTEWTVHTFELELRDIFFFNAREGVACGYGAIFRTNDGGESWQAVKCPDEFYTALLPDQENNVWAAGFNGGVFRSADRGVSWNEVVGGNGFLDSRRHFSGMHGLGSFMALCGPGGLLGYSFDRGQSWESQKAFENAPLKSVLVSSEGNGVVCGNGGRLFLFRVKK